MIPFFRFAAQKIHTLRKYFFSDGGSKTVTDVFCFPFSSAVKSQQL